MELPPSPPLPPASSPPPPGPSSVPAGASSAPVGVWDAQRRRDRLIGLLIVAVAFAACIVLTIWAKEKSEPEQSVPPGPPTVEGVVGYPSEVDPIESLKAARKLTRRSALRGFVLDGVSPNGTIDLADAANRARYSFQSEPGQGPQPPREPGTLPKRITCGKQNVILRNGGLVAEPDQADYPCGSGGVEALPEP